MFAMPLDFVKQNMVMPLFQCHLRGREGINPTLQAKGDAGPSIAATLLGELDPNEDNSELEPVIRSATGTAYVGAC